VKKLSSWALADTAQHVPTTSNIILLIKVFSCHISLRTANLFFNPVLAWLPSKYYTQGRSAEVDVVNYWGRIKIPFEVSVDEREIDDPPSPVPDTRGCLPGEFRFAGTNIKVVG
jgi:hypothetical protein